MRTTLSIDDDLAVLLRQEMQRNGTPYKQLVNHLLRVGLAQERGPKSSVGFQVKARKMGVSAGQSYDNVAELLEHLEGPEHR